jgi:hypothetical protein
MTKLYQTGKANFIIRSADENDTSLILYFIKALALYEKMSDRVIATEKKFRLVLHYTIKHILLFKERQICF